MGNCGCSNKMEGGLMVGGPGQPDVVIDVCCAPYETGFKFNTIPFGGMTIDQGNAVRLGSATDIKLVPPSGNTVIVGTTGSAPTASATYRGAIFLVQGDSTHADVLQICLKDASNNYAWHTFTTS